MDKYRIDGHKLIYHVSRVNDWLKGKEVYPIYMEISPAGACNHRCIYCGLDFMEYRPRYLDTAMLKDRLSELGKVGLKSIMYAGEGEPFLHKDIAEIISHTKKSGIDIGITTNGALFSREIADKILANTEWIKVSIDASSPAAYARIHRCNPGDFDRVIENMSYAAKLRKEKKYRCTLGMQLLLLPENEHEVVALAKIAKKIGMDYLTVKPYSQHPQSKTRLHSSVAYNDYEYLSDKLAELNSDNFNVILRLHTMEKWNKQTKNYGKCLALTFWSYIDAGGNVWGCSVYLGNRKFLYGNIYKQSFKEIWKGQARLRSLKWAEKELDATQCRINCRMDEVNSYLWELRSPPPHVNFI